MQSGVLIIVADLSGNKAAVSILGKMMMKKLLLLGSSKRTIQLINYAKSIGIYTIVTDYRDPELSVGKKIADEYWMVSTADIDKLEDCCHEENIDAVCCGTSEYSLEKTMELCERLNLPCYCNKYAWHFSRNKYDFKKICRECAVPVAEDYSISDALSEEELSSVIFPVVVKPIDQRGNQGMSYCYNRNELIKGYRYARSVSDNPRIIVERMLVGREWYTYYAFADGEVRQICLNEMLAQPGEPKNIYSITTTCTNHVERIMKEVNPQIEKALLKIGCREGIAWVQLMLDQNDRFYVLEMGYRFPGDSPDEAYPFLFGFDADKWVLDYALGVKHSINDLPAAQEHVYQKCSCGYSLWTNRAGVISSIKGFDKIDQEAGISCVSVNNKGWVFQKYYVFATISITAENIDDLCRKIDYINRTVSVLDEGGRDVVIRFTDFETIRANYYQGHAEKEGAVQASIL